LILIIGWTRELKQALRPIMVLSGELSKDSARIIG
jgi:hypothetical protein